MSARLRVMTANLGKGHADPGAFAQLVDSLGADVVAVQELFPEQADALASVMRFGRLEPARDHTGMGIAVREGGAVRPVAVRRHSLPYRDAHVAELVPTQASDAMDTIELINVHVVAPVKHPMWHTFWYRRDQLRGLEAHLDGSPTRRRIVVGDLNATPLWRVYRRLARRLTDGAAAVARRNGHRPRRTWGPWPGAPRLLRIDHVLVSGVAVHDVRTVPIAGSDHDALVADLSVPADADGSQR